ncbi:MAG: SxtJ family membrane protein [Rhodospirillales bacterium]
MAERTEAAATMGSERSFAIVFAVVFIIIGCFPLLYGGGLRLWSLGIAVAFLAAGFLCPVILRPLNRLWFQIGLLMHRVVNPVIMGLIFFLAVTPTGLIMRALGKDPLRRAFDRDAGTYWIERNPPGPDPQSMKNQF